MINITLRITSERLLHLLKSTTEKFEETFAQHFYNLFNYTQEHQAILNHVGLGTIIKWTAFLFRKIDSKSPHARSSFTHDYLDSELLLKQLQEFIDKYAHKVDLTDNKKLFNYLDDTDKKKLFILRRIFLETDKYAQIHRKNLTPSNEFKKFIEKLTGQYGLYFLYNIDKEILYIGKSIDLGNRVVGSINERKAVDGYVAIATTKTKADIHVYEPFYIIQEAPPLNAEFNDFDSLSIELPPLTKTKLIKIYNEKKK